MKLFPKLVYYRSSTDCHTCVDNTLWSILLCAHAFVITPLLFWFWWSVKITWLSYTLPSGTAPLHASCMSDPWRERKDPRRNNDSALSQQHLTATLVAMNQAAFTAKIIVGLEHDRDNTLTYSTARIKFGKNLLISIEWWFRFLLELLVEVLIWETSVYFSMQVYSHDACPLLQDKMLTTLTVMRCTSVANLVSHTDERPPTKLYLISAEAKGTKILQKVL
jgi:hypothetical protein